MIQSSRVEELIRSVGRELKGCGSKDTDVNPVSKVRGILRNLFARDYLSPALSAGDRINLYIVFQKKTPPQRHSLFSFLLFFWNPIRFNQQKWLALPVSLWWDGQQINQTNKQTNIATKQWRTCPLIALPYTFSHPKSLLCDLTAFPRGSGLVFAPQTQPGWFKGIHHQCVPTFCFATHSVTLNSI